MFKKSLAVAAGSLSIVAGSAGMACADTTGIGGGQTVVFGDQTGIVNLNAPLVDLRCATPWFGSAVLGVSLPIGEQAVVCNDIRGTVTQMHEGKNSLL